MVSSDKYLKQIVTNALVNEGFISKLVNDLVDAIARNKNARIADLIKNDPEIKMLKASFEQHANNIADIIAQRNKTYKFNLKASKA